MKRRIIQRKLRHLINDQIKLRLHPHVGLSEAEKHDIVNCIVALEMAIEALNGLSNEQATLMHHKSSSRATVLSNRFYKAEGTQNNLFPPSVLPSIHER